jgi:predicted alpha/beta hydrolase family esterase
MPQERSILFIQGGGGADGYEADAKLVASLQATLGEEYPIRYPRMPGDDEPSASWEKQIGEEISAMGDGSILVAHSFGASALLQYLSEHVIKKQIAGVFLVAAPFWGEGGWQYEEVFSMREKFADFLPKDVPFFFYHSRDDEEVPFAHFELYKEELPWAVFREQESGGHQFGNNLAMVAKDIRGLFGGETADSAEA